MVMTIMTMLMTMAMTIGHADDNPQAPVAPRLPRQHHGSLQLLGREEAPQSEPLQSELLTNTQSQDCSGSAFTLWDENASAYIVVPKPLN